MNICVFLSFYDQKGEYAPIVRELGSLIGKNGHNLVWGGSEGGLMKILADSVEDSGGKLIGISVEFLKAKARQKAHEMTIAKDMPERKALMLARSDAFIVLPGGLGTLDEVSEILEIKKHHVHEKPIVILNVGSFYDGLRAQLKRMHDEGFIPRPLNELLVFVKTPKEAMDNLATQ